MLYSLAACSSRSSDFETNAVASSTAAYASSSNERTMSTGKSAAMDTAVQEAAPQSPPVGGEGYIQSTPVSASSRLVIKTVNLTMQTLEFDKGVDDIESVVLAYEGFMQDSYVQGKSMFEKHGTRSASFTIRIPSERLDVFVNEMSQKYNVIDKRQSGEDITDSYYDTDARLKSLKVQEDRLIAMLEKAGELEYLLQVERELANVRYEIESLTSTLLRMQNRVNMSTVYLSLQEVIEYTPVDPPPVTFGQRIVYTFSNSINSFKEFTQGLILVVVWILPFILLLGVIAAVIIIISVKANKRKKNEKPGEYQLPVLQHENDGDDNQQK